MEDAIAHASISFAAVGFVAPCLPSLANRPPKGAGWIHEIKHDGFWMMVRRNGSAIHEKRVRLDGPVSTHSTSGTCASGQLISP